MKDPLDRFLGRVDLLLDRLEKILPAGAQPVDWSAATAFRWRKRGERGFLEPVRHPHTIAFADLKDIDEQKRRVRENTAQFVAGKPANNVLLTGARGTGKSSLVKAALNEFAKKGLRLIEVDKSHLVDLPDIVDLVAGRRERFIVFCDDLSFEASDPGYKSLKVALDGTIAGSAENLLIYATSNRRHLMPEFMGENLEAKHRGGEIHPGETTEEKISLSERFGLWLSFYPFDQDEYLDIAEHWVGVLGGRADAALKPAALVWALERGSRSGRVAWQFAKDYVGRGTGARARK
ncbi:MAG: ATP-binding protein [Betaproteobacteria bacterium]|jgi:predicted AAA+ superfamily ATPase|nr:ATP-binding protein [Betaproteobacteria bacterium]